jgi:chromosome segregation ATPase
MTQDEIIASNLSELEKANERIKMLEDKLASIKHAIAKLESQEPVAWDLADKVRQDLDRQSCPDAFMRIAVESIVKHHPAQPAQRTEQNFCSRCGKRTKDLTHIHTCTPPQD